MQMQRDFLSPFGGFWTDTLDREQCLAKLFADGTVDPEEASLLHFWMDNGYVIIPAVLSAPEVAQTQRAIDGMIDRHERQMTYWDEGLKHMHLADRSKLGAAECKVIDVHASDHHVQHALFAPKLARFLELVMQSKAIAFQTLYFENGSQQPIHQDTAFVYVDPPLEFIASWIALEDVAPGCGELIFHEGSHRLPDELYGDPPGKALYGNDPRAATYSDELGRRCEEAGMRLERFLPKAGDVLLWAADLAHGGSPRTNERTRRSLVTHYCPVHRRPPYAQAGYSPVQLPNGHAILSAT